MSDLQVLPRPSRARWAPVCEMQGLSRRRSCACLAPVSDFLLLLRKRWRLRPAFAVVAPQSPVFALEVVAPQSPVDAATAGDERGEVVVPVSRGSQATLSAWFVL